MTVLCLSLLFAATQYAPLQPISPSVVNLAGTVAGDFDLDGDVDMIALNRLNGDSMFFEAVLPGEFAAPRPIRFGDDYMEGAVCGDLTGDGQLDLVIATRGSAERLLFVEGRGDGTFETPQPLGAVGVFNGTPRLVDLNQDGQIDILATGRGDFGARLTIYQNLGAGTFAPPRQLTGDPANDAQVLDVDGDGDLDILTASDIGNLALFLNDGNGLFGYSGALDFFTSASQLELLDLDGDGDLDAIARSKHGSSVLALENLGGGTFGPRQEFLPAMSGTSRIVIVDVDRDGQDDVVVFSDSAEAPIWLRNEPGFMLGASQPLIAMASFVARGVEAVDLSADGILDFVISAGAGTGGARAVRIVQSDASLGTVPYGESTAILTQVPGMRDVAAIDVDADGDLDVVGVSTSGELYIAAGRGFTRRDLPVSLGTMAGSTLEAADLDSDGDLDLVTIDSLGRPVMLENTGAGILTPQYLTPGAISFSQRFELEDMDGDGQLDIVGIGDSFEIVVVMQTGGGVFLPPASVATFTDLVWRVMVADVNLDGRPDISASVRYQDGTAPPPRRLVWLEGTGTGAFGPSAVLIDGLEPVLRPLPFRLNSSGFIEFIWMSSTARASFVATSLASSTYTISDLGVDPGGPNARFAIGNLRGDGLGDLVVAGGPSAGDSPQTLRVYSRSGSSLNQLDGVLAEGLREVRSIRFVDLDGDRDEDILLAAGEGPQLSWIENLRSGLIGTNFCGPAVLNSQGQSARLSAVGSDLTSFNDLTLRGADVTANATSLFLVSQGQDFAPNVPGSVGALCLGGAIGRYQGAGQVQTASADGTIQLDLELDAIPQPNGAVPALAGTLWFFQAWYRDTAAGQPSSNFTDGLAIVFR